VNFEQSTVRELAADQHAAYQIENEDERYAATSSIAHRIHDFVNANDLTFWSGDLTTRVDGEWRYEKIRRETRERRQCLISAVRPFLREGLTLERQDLTELVRAFLARKATYADLKEAVGR